jgi:putative endopeptidase
MQSTLLTLILLFSLISPPARADEPLPPIMDATALQDGKDGRASVDPCEDFYKFACGAWLDRTKIPADKTSVNRQTTAAMDATDSQLNKILEAWAKGDFSIQATYSGKVRDFYMSCMDMEKEGPAAAATAKKMAAAIRTAKSRQAFARLVATMQMAGAAPFFGFASGQDLDDSTKVIGMIGQGGLGLGQRDYYLNTDEKSLDILAHYKDHVAKILALTGASSEQAKAGAETVLRIETELAKASYSIADDADPSKTDHPMPLAGVVKIAPHFDWATYFHTLGNTHLARMNLMEPEFFQGLDHLLAESKLEDLHVYLIWQFMHSVAGDLGGDFHKENFQFWSAYLSGAKEEKPRWKVCTQRVESMLGYALAEAYVKTFDGKAIKAKTEEMIRQIKSAFTNDLHNISSGGPDSWMDADTAAKAIEKVAAVAQKVGAPEKWRNYSSLKTSRNDMLGNVFAVNRFESRRDINKIGKPVDRTEWGMMPWEINAYYDRSRNEFNFPFGILQPPSLDLNATDGANLGSFGGGTIGHELTHGFDNNGSKYDKLGNLKNWWSDATLKQFQDKTSCYVDAANQYKINLTGLNVNGAQTLEENLADQGGVKLGYVALDEVLKGRPEGALWDEKYSERQQYWIAYAQSWCTQITAESLREQMTTDVHPPAEFRVNAVLMNRPEFARDFSCKAGSRMAPVKRCSLW